MTNQICFVKYADILAKRFEHWYNVSIAKQDKRELQLFSFVVRSFHNSVNVILDKERLPNLKRRQASKSRRIFLKFGRMSIDHRSFGIK